MPAYSLEDFCDDVRTTLTENDDHDGRDTVRRKLEQLLKDPEFLARYVGAENDKGVSQIYEDPDLKFCVLAYNMEAPRKSPPHDHGSSWAVYGQAVGHTDMTVWQADEDSGLQPKASFRLSPGQAGLFDVGDIHSIEYAQGAKFVRVTGVDLSEVTRRVYDAETGEAREIAQVGTGSASS